ncbi:MAG: PHP-associated domain-containing protein [bacterium]
MTPYNIVQECRAKEIDLIAVCDHNSAENVQWVQKVAEKFNISILPGMEITTSEEVHLLAFFDSIEKVMELQDFVYSHLLPGENDDDIFGMQVVANDKDEVEKIVHKLLIGGTNISLNKATEKIHSLNGLAVPAHIDRESFSVLAQLGFIPDDMDADALEISFRGQTNKILSIPGVKKFSILRSSDAHQLSDIGRATTSIFIDTVSINEFKKAFNCKDGRYVDSFDKQGRMKQYC